MSETKLLRPPKRQLGQFYTPPDVASNVIHHLHISSHERVLEPSFGAGSFVFAILQQMKQQDTSENAREWATKNLYGCELDPQAIRQFDMIWRAHNLGPRPHTITHADFFRWLPPNCDPKAALRPELYFQYSLEFFDVIIGNPPFGGSFDPAIEDTLDRIFGIRDGNKIKKETYAFFLVKSVDLLKPGGRLCFVCSDTILTIPTMFGLRSWLQTHCHVEITRVPGLFTETTQKLVLITLIKRANQGTITVFGRATKISDVKLTPNFSWRIDQAQARYFRGPLLGDKLVASSGMTTGNNRLFLREIVEGAVIEPYEFLLAEERVTLSRELRRARLGRLSDAQSASILERELKGDTIRVVRWTQRSTAKVVHVPHRDYRYFNKATSAIIYERPRWVIFWKDNGEYVYTYKRSGKWYLHGVGGKRYFGREGLTWSLIAPRLRTRWLPTGYILDSGAPCAFLRPGVDREELLFIMGWTLTDLCTGILKNVINHTRNIQSKDFERLPYPYWIAEHTKKEAIAHVANLIQQAVDGARFSFDSEEVSALNKMYEYREGVDVSRKDVATYEHQGRLDFGNEWTTTPHHKEDGGSIRGIIRENRRATT